MFLRRERQAWYAGDVKRRLRLIPICLLLGAAINVAIAWAFALLPTGIGNVEYCTNPQAYRPSDILLIHYFGYSSMRDPIRVFLMVAPHKPEATRFRGPVWWDNSALVATREPFAIAAGWPLRTLSAWREPPDVGDAFVWGADLARGTASNPVVIPLHPIARNFAINTAFYAATLWGLVAGIGAMRSMRRTRRGLCPRCAYPRESHAVCPECGAKHNRKMTEPVPHALPPA